MVRDKRRVIFLPNWSRANPYQSLLIEALSAQGFEASLADYPKARLPLLRLALANRDVGIFHLHWIDPWIEQMFWTTHPVKRSIKLFLMAMDIALCRLLGVHTYWTIHNLVSHESKDAAWELRIRRRIARLVSGCFVHSRSALGLLEQNYGFPLAAKTSVVPHASYVGQYPAANPGAVTLMRYELGLGEADFVYLFLGSIRKYKGIEGLIDAFGKIRTSGARLVIVGSVLDPALKDWLREAASKDERIVLRIGYVPDEALPVYLDLASVVVLPFAQTLTSGSALLAMTFAKPLILPEAARIYDFPGDEGAIHYEEGGLKTALLAAQGRDLDVMGAFNRREAEARSWARMGALTAAGYAGENGKRPGEDRKEHHSRVTP